MPNITVTDHLITAVWNKMSNDPSRKKGRIASKNSQDTKLFLILQDFIANQLIDLDRSLAINFRNKEKADGTYFSEKTLKRALYGDKRASKDMVNMLGYYSLGEDWDIQEKPSLFPPDSPRDINGHLPHLRKEIEKGASSEDNTKIINEVIEILGLVILGIIYVKVQQFFCGKTPHNLLKNKILKKLRESSVLSLKQFGKKKSLLKDSNI